MDEWHKTSRTKMEAVCAKEHVQVPLHYSKTKLWCGTVIMTYHLTLLHTFKARATSKQGQYRTAGTNVQKLMSNREKRNSSTHTAHQRNTSANTRRRRNAVGLVRTLFLGTITLNRGRDSFKVRKLWSHNNQTILLWYRPCCYRTACWKSHSEQQVLSRYI